MAVLPYRVRYAPVCPKCTIAEEDYCVRLCIRFVWFAPGCPKCVVTGLNTKSF